LEKSDKNIMVIPKSFNHDYKTYIWEYNRNNFEYGQRLNEQAFTRFFRVQSALFYL
jgi:hypothetical protein